MNDDTPTGPASAADTLSATPEHPAGGETATPPAAPWADADGTWKLGEGDAAQPWYATVPEEDARATMEAKNYANPAELALAYSNLLKMSKGSDNVVSIPGEGAEDTQWDNFYRALGRPDKAEDYEFTHAEDVKVDEDMVSFGKQMFHAMGVSAKQAQIGVTMWDKFVGEQNAALAEQWNTDNAKDVDALKAKHGDNFDTFIEAGKRVVYSAGLSKELIAKLEDDMGTASVLELFSTIGAKSSEGTFLTTSSGGTSAVDMMTPQQAQEEIDKLNADEKHMAAINNANDPNHKVELDRREKLFARL